MNLTKIITIGASIVVTLATLAGDWAKKKQEEEEFDRKFDEKFDERMTHYQEVEFTEVKEEE